MVRYSAEFKEKIAQKMIPPTSASIAQIHRETRVSKPTVQLWKNTFQQGGKTVPANPENWRGENKLSVINKVAPLNKHELSKYCRKKGLYVEKLNIGENLPNCLGGTEPLTKGEKACWKREKKEFILIKSDSPYQTLKYTPAYPNKPFQNIEVAREWVHLFVRWYNLEHRHSAIQFVTPDQRHRGEDRELLKKRRQIYGLAKQRNPQRWS
jgi:hypothetical protein